VTGRSGNNHALECLGMQLCNCRCQSACHSECLRILRRGSYYYKEAATASAAMISPKFKALLPAIGCGLALSCSGPIETPTASSLPTGIVDDRLKVSNPSDEYGDIIAKYGRPERDDSTEYDTPRPPIVTRIVEYRPENVKIAFIPVGKVGEPPPYYAWKIIGYIDINTNTKMLSEEAAARLGRRSKR
jgi:hypothetical protein